MGSKVPVCRILILLVRANSKVATKVVAIADLYVMVECSPCGKNFVNTVQSGTSPTSSRKRFKASSIEKIFRENNHSKKELAEKIGTEIAKRSIKNGVKEVAFDKGKYKYHGLIKILAEAAREAGLNF